MKRKKEGTGRSRRTQWSDEKKEAKLVYCNRNEKDKSVKGCELSASLSEGMGRQTRELREEKQRR